MSSFWSDLRHGARLVIIRPWFAAAAIATLALGIGASTSIFSAVNAVLLRPLPFRDAERIMRLWESNPQKGSERDPVSPSNFVDWREQSQAFEEMAAYISWSPNFIGDDGAERLHSVQVSENMFQLLGVSPIRGRSFGPGDARSADGNVVIISHDLWRRRFALDPNVTDRTINLNGKGYSIIGVMPAGFQFPVGGEKKDLWAPLIFDADDQNSRAGRYLQVVGHLKPGVSLDQARREMQRVASLLEQAYPEANSGWSIALMPYREQLVADARPMLLVMLAAVGFVLLIGCANVANLLLARAAGRNSEMAVRVAVGASRGRIVRQLLTESLVLAVMGGALGALIAKGANKLIIATAPGGIPRLDEVSLDTRVLAFSAALSLLTAFLFGLFPALQASKPNLSHVLREGGKGVFGGRGRNLFRGILVVTEVALALVLLVGAGLMVKSFDRLIGVRSGFNPQGVLTAQISLPSYKYESPQQQKDFFEQLVESVEVLPGVQAAGVISYLPLSGSNMEWIFSIEGLAPSSPDEKLFAEYRQVSARYFDALGIPLLRGRVFSGTDNTGSLPVIIINEAFARRYFPNENPLHKRIGFGLKPDWREIVGIVTDVKHFGLESEAKPEAYVPFQQDPWPSMALVVRATPDPTLVIGAVRNQVRAIDRNQPLYDVQTMESLVSESIAPRRLGMLLLGIFSGVALVLAAIGVFGVMANSVNQRSHEIAIRIALGAAPASIKRLIVLQAAAMAILGIGIGLIASRFLTRLIARLLYDVSTTDPLVLGAVALALAFVLILASYIPARRATAIDPMTALK